MQVTVEWVLLPLALDAGEHNALDEVPLSKEEHHDDRHNGDHCSSHRQVPLNGVGRVSEGPYA